MLTFTPWRVDQTKILTRRELAAVLADLTRKAPRSPSTRLNRIVFRLPRPQETRSGGLSALSHQLAEFRRHLWRIAEPTH